MERPPTSAATAAYPATPVAVAPMAVPAVATASRTAGMADAAAVLVDDPADSEVGNCRVRPSALMKSGDAL